MSKYRFQCKFCDARFVMEKRFMDHRCKAMERDEEIRTPIGMAALNYYRSWMSIQKRITPSVETFLNSKMYTTFVNFAKYAQKVGIPNVDQYIKYMVRKDIHPTIWANDGIYGQYLQYLDRGADPMEQAKHTVDFLFKLADALQCTPGEIFDHLHANEVILLLQQRQMTPWILLYSNKFKEFLVNKTTSEQRITIQTIIKPNFWVEKRKSHPDVAQTMKEIVRELKL